VLSEVLSEVLLGVLKQEKSWSCAVFCWGGTAYQISRSEAARIHAREDRKRTWYSRMVTATPTSNKE
jgi:hypothetical protein